jgi:hypothetical protein
MDATEVLVAEFLAKKGHTNIVYEPDGNVPPDFLLNDQIAVEARRLNQSYDAGGDAQGLEEVAIPLWQKVKRLCLSFGPPTRGESWFVFFRFSRPVEPWKTLEPKLRNYLQGFISTQNQKKTSFSIAPSFQFQIFRASTLQPTFYVMAGHSDQEAGGWLVAEIEKNLRIYIDEKTEKIRKFRSKYPVWWLVLVDRIAYGLDDFDLEMFKKEVSIQHEWDKVIVVDPNNSGRSFEV